MKPQSDSNAAPKAAPADDRYPHFSTADIEKMMRFGMIEHWRSGDVMFRIGQPGLGMRVLLSGRARLSRRDGLGRSQTIVELGAGQFLGEVAQLTGKPALADGLALDDVDALMIPPQQIRDMLVAEAHLGERIMRSLVLRRFGLVREGAGPVLIGRSGDLRLLALEGLLHRLGHPYSVADPRPIPTSAICSKNGAYGTTMCPSSCSRTARRCEIPMNVNWPRAWACCPNSTRRALTTLP
ncbi:hypothetical protein PPGU19_045890 [Paraburkholderia sp. PGU19]|nr:hypothetical protein PPGU19_045890 [Paraburkholderia sp. PGU19]